MYTRNLVVERFWGDGRDRYCENYQDVLIVKESIAAFNFRSRITIS
jgi:hypothetical protein